MFFLLDTVKKLFTKNEKSKFKKILRSNTISEKKRYASYLPYGSLGRSQADFMRSSYFTRGQFFD